MDKIKICPQCGQHNSPGEFDCTTCGADLMAVPVTDPCAIPQEPEPAAPPEPSASAFVRICEECGTENPPAMRKCRNCHEDISHIAPTPAAACTEPACAVLETADGYAFTIAAGCTVTIGRDSQMADYLRSHAFVSRSHAELSFHDGALWVRDLGSTNHTFVNDEPVSDEACRLAGQDRLSLGGTLQNGSPQPQAAYFTVRYL